MEGSLEVAVTTRDSSDSAVGPGLRPERVTIWGPATAVIERLPMGSSVGESFTLATEIWTVAVAEAAWPLPTV